MMKRIHTLLSILFFFICFTATPRSYTVRFFLKNQPDHPVVLGTLRGDRFIPVDTVDVHPAGDEWLGGAELQQHPAHPLKLASFSLPDNAVRGMYRLVLGQTTYARVMGESPQQLDFIFNQEDVVLKTDFKSPADSVKVISSNENRVWFDFVRKERTYRKKLDMLEKEVDHCWAQMDEVKSSYELDARSQQAEAEARAAQKANSFNQLQLERDRMIFQLAERHDSLWASRLIRTQRDPFRDGYLNEKERRAAFQKEYFRYIDFSDESLINSPVLTDKVFDFLVIYNQRDFNREQREAAYIRAVNAIMEEVEQDYQEPSSGYAMYEFILNYLVNGFEKLNMENVLIYMADHHLGKFCQRAGEKTTLERKLKAQKMKVGTEVPDFTLNDMTGRPVTLSRTAGSRNLIIFWASWCPHCLEMLPRIKSWYKGLPDPDLKIFAISLDHARQDWQDAVKQTGFKDFINLSDLLEWDGPVAESYNVYATPTMFLTDRELRIIAKPFTVNDLVQQVSP